jgi:hypothetical protein
MQPILVPETAESTRTSEYDYRVLFLSGTWQTPIGSEFRLRATLYVQQDGSVDGCIYWRAVRIRGVPQCYFGTEAVRGFVKGRELELRGHYADHPGLALDVYEILLTGNDEAGVFAGRSRAYGDWSGRLEGQYRFQNRKK